MSIGDPACRSIQSSRISQPRGARRRTAADRKKRHPANREGRVLVWERRREQRQGEGEPGESGRAVQVSSQRAREIDRRDQEHREVMLLREVPTSRPAATAVPTASRPGLPDPARASPRVRPGREEGPGDRQPCNSRDCDRIPGRIRTNRCMNSPEVDWKVTSTPVVGAGHPRPGPQRTASSRRACEPDRQGGEGDRGPDGDHDGPGRATDGQHEQERDTPRARSHSHTDSDPRRRTAGP